MTTSCTPAFIQSIKDFQEICYQSRGGRISPSTANGRHSQGTHLIAGMDGSIRKRYPGIWPRIDRINTVRAPAQVSTFIRRVL
ncbi:hypothetical protein [Thermomonas sp. HDW16]|uniref:hypothetical protein n=1 Tax=Thermomonas sp. HDW16 TaxID=2714945 RepID=UPI00140D4626|nr:hypothetical protein [Thermomonas sp. HDW16]QIL19262.1 hypothetical protein G7079_00090 [Thermomonas sp. HDW16]